MIRIGFLLPSNDSGWVGGLNYFRNLLSAIKSLATREIEPVLLTSCNVSQSNLPLLSEYENIRLPILDHASMQWKYSKLKQRIIGCDRGFERILGSHNLNILSHSGHLGWNTILPTLGWIPDFQHMYMPELFSVAEVRRRNAQFLRLLKYCTATIVSSQDSLKDCYHFAPDLASKCRVLQFVSAISNNPADSTISQLRKKYNIKEKYFHLPNQFWKHKNHHIVLNALAIIKKQNINIQVVSTGSTKIGRHSDHFEYLMRLIQDAGLSDHFKILGLIPYSDLQVLLRNAIAIINPSFFEGWSTSVEESKSLGKSIILSDISVHREQAPQRGYYFKPNDPETLAELLIGLDRDFDKENDDRFQREAQKRLPERMREFGASYQKLVLETLGLAA